MFPACYQKLGFLSKANYKYNYQLSLAWLTLGHILPLAQNYITYYLNLGKHNTSLKKNASYINQIVWNFNWDLCLFCNSFSRSTMKHMNNFEWHWKAQAWGNNSAFGDDWIENLVLTKIYGITKCIRELPCKNSSLQLRLWKESFS